MPQHSIDNNLLRLIESAMKDLWGQPLFNRSYSDKEWLKRHFIEWWPNISKFSEREVEYAKKAIKREMIAENTDVKFSSLPTMIRYMAACPKVDAVNIKPELSPEERAATDKHREKVVNEIYRSFDK